MGPERHGREFPGLCRDRGVESRTGHHTPIGNAMAKGQKKSNKEIRKPKAEKPKKHNASNPSLKPGSIRGLENMKNS